MKIRSLVALSVCGAGLSLPMAQAQQAQPAQQNQNVTQRTTGAQNDGDRNHAAGQLNDHALASCVAIANQEEVAMAKFAEGKAHSKKVKEFASMIAKDHREFLHKLERFAPEATKDGYISDSADRRSASSDDQSRNRGDDTARNRNEVKVQTAGAAVKVGTNENRVDQTGANDANSGRMMHSTAMLNLHRELAQECLSQARENLGKKDGDEFDRCFMAAQAVKHGEMKVMLTVFERHASGELRDILAEGLKTTGDHLQKAEEVLKDLDHSSKSDGKSSTNRSSSDNKSDSKKE
jgi:predicted outer membrane protein